MSNAVSPQMIVVKWEIMPGIGSVWINTITFLQITEWLPKTLSGKNVRMLLKRVAQHPSMKGKQQVNMAEIKEYSGLDIESGFMQICK